jgi:hypothetical protein
MKCGSEIDKKVIFTMNNSKYLIGDNTLVELAGFADFATPERLFCRFCRNKYA